ncbi:MAG: Eco57I restriction-modification methylase domain-containing protein, partial [Thermoplasmata archaeon]
ISANTLMKLEKELKQNIKHEKNSQFLILNPEKELHQLKQELLSLYKRYFSIRTRKEKIEISNKEREIRNKIREILEKSIGIIPQTAKKIADFDIFNQLSTTDWFDPEWMFGIEDGFDIVIGNPPYIRQEKLKPIKELLKKNYKDIFNSTSDIYIYFFARGYELLKEGGILTYITSNKWMRAKYGEKIREFFKDKARIEYILDFSGHKVFESATVDTSIIAIKKLKEKNPNIKVAVIDSLAEGENLKDKIKQKLIHINQDKLSSQVYILEDDTVLKLKEKIEKIGKPLKDWDVRIYIGIITGYNKAFIIDSQKREEILKNCRDEEERKRTEQIIKPILRGRDIGRYYYQWAGLWVILAKFNFHKQAHLYPAVVDYLKRFENKLKNRGQCKYTRSNKTTFEDYPGQHHWLELDNNPKDEYISEFEKDKIVWQRVAKRFSFCLVPAGMYILDSMAFMISQSWSKYLIGVLNSLTIEWYVRNYVHQYSNTGFLLSNQYVERAHIPPITEENKPIAQQIENLVSQILELKSVDPQTDTTHLEKQIDQLVYKLYNLTEEEIKLIEGRKHE